MPVISARELLLTSSNQIECNLCGECCPPECAHLTAKLCSLHPRQHEKDPSLAACELGPAELVVYFGIRCPPALDKLKMQTGVDVGASSVDSRFCNKETLNMALNMKLSIG